MVARIVITVAVIVTAAIGLLQADRSQPSATPLLPTTRASSIPAHVSTTAPSGSVQPSTSTVPASLRLPALLAPDEEIDVYARISGYVAELKVDIGSTVKKGDLLLAIDAPELLADARAAEAMVTAKQARLGAARAKMDQSSLFVEAAKAELARYAAEFELQKVTASRKEELLKGNAIPQQEIDDARGRLAIAAAQSKTAEAKVAAAQGDLRAAEAEEKVAEAEIAVSTAQRDHAQTLSSYMRIEAAFDGTITRRHFDVGAFVKSAAQGNASPIMTLTRQDRLRLRLEVPEAEIARVRIGTPVTFQVRGLEGRTFRAQISRLSRSLRSDSRTMPAEADVDNVDGSLTPGMYTQVSIDLSAPPAGSR